MDLLFQFGHGMMAHTRELVQRWQGGGVILSPRDMNESQLEKTARTTKEAGGIALLDPQCFAHDADHKRLTNHAYWKVFAEHNTGALLDGPGAEEFVAAIWKANQDLNTNAFILPGLLSADGSDAWFAMQEVIADVAKQVAPDAIRIHTIALGENVLRSEEFVDRVVDEAEKWSVEGYYVVPESPGAYLVDEPAWLANLLSLVAGLRLQRRMVFVGYCSHQSLILAAANANAISSGTWLNVRSFPPSKFYTPPEGEMSRRALWYYCPQALSEYKIPFLDLARDAGLMDELRPRNPASRTYSDPLFAGARPSAIDWGEQSAFRHYLACLRTQAQEASKPTFDETIAAHHALLDDAEATLLKLRAKGVLGQDRDFNNRLDVNRAALMRFVSAWGPRLRREWSALDAQ